MSLCHLLRVLSQQAIIASLCKIYFVTVHRRDVSILFQAVHAPPIIPRLLQTIRMIKSVARLEAEGFATRAELEDERRMHDTTIRLNVYARF